MAGQITAATAELQQRAHAFSVQLADIAAPTLLDKNAAFRFFRGLLNFAPHKVDVDLKYDTHLDFFAADSPVECHRDHLDVDGYRVRVLTIKDPPAKTFAGILQDLCAIPTSFIACLEWQRLSNAKMRRELHARRRHFFNRRVSLVNYVSTQTKPEEMLDR